MIKKRILPLVCVVASLMALTSCFEETGYSYTSTFSRIVSINRKATPIELVADYTGEKFKLANLTSEEQLSLYDLEDAERAFVTINMEVDNSYKPTLTLVEGKAIKVNPIWNKPLPEGANINALSGMKNFAVESAWSYPVAWVANGYVNMAPVIKSKGRGTYYLQPQKAYGDTLRFDVVAAFTPATTENYIADFVNFDLRTLTDTTEADALTRDKVRNVLNAVASNDSVCLMIVGDFHKKYTKVDTLSNGTVRYEERDTIVKSTALTNYTYLKSLLK